MGTRPIRQLPELADGNACVKLVAMSAATIHNIADVDPTNAMINRTIRAVMAIRDMDPADLWASAGITKGTYYNRMKGRGDWTAPEVKRAADALGVSVATLYDGLQVAGAGFEPATSGSRAQVIDLAARRAARAAA
jgi:hypothetical protein